MNETTITTVAAQPGWFIATIHCVDDADRGVLALDPIVAWEISRFASIEPSPGCPGELEIWREVTPIAFGNNDFRIYQCWAIKTPDGKFDTPGDCTFDDEATALDRLWQNYNSWRHPSVRLSSGAPWKAGACREPRSCAGTRTDRHRAARVAH